MTQLTEIITIDSNDPMAQLPQLTKMTKTGSNDPLQYIAYLPEPVRQAKSYTQCLISFSGEHVKPNPSFLVARARNMIETFVTEPQ